jgi:hypothetical protein
VARSASGVSASLINPSLAAALAPDAQEPAREGLEGSARASACEGRGSVLSGCQTRVCGLSGDLGLPAAFGRPWRNLRKGRHATDAPAPHCHDGAPRARPQPGRGERRGANGRAATTP